jgi:hypothetical protein
LLAWLGWATFLTSDSVARLFPVIWDIHPGKPENPKTNPGSMRFVTAAEAGSKALGPFTLSTTLPSIISRLVPPGYQGQRIFNLPVRQHNKHQNWPNYCAFALSHTWHSRDNKTIYIKLEVLGALRPKLLAPAEGWWPSAA